MSDGAGRGGVARARALLDELRHRPLSDAELASAATELGGLLLDAAERLKTPGEQSRDALMARLMQDPRGQAFTTLLTDRVYRSVAPGRVVDVARELLRELSVPRYMPALARLQLRALLHFGTFAPRLAARAMLAHLRAETAHVVLPAEEPALSEHLSARRAQGVRVNLNHLGEAVLGSAKADERVRQYVGLLERTDVEAISVKVSSIDSQIDLLAWEKSVSRLTERLRTIYRAALRHHYETPDGGRRAKLVNLDMEAYRDLHVTLASFRRALDDPELAALTAGVALQAYLPESARLQRELTDWARARVAAGGAPIRLRVVKGANLLSESVGASLRGLTLPIFASKHEVDASFKKIVDYGCAPEHVAAVRLGIASHNVFDLACGAVLCAMRGVEDGVEFELLQGMAEPLLRALLGTIGTGDRGRRRLLVYTPIVDEGSMETAIAYLMRRFDENTAPQNFLHASFGMRAGDAAFTAQRERFKRALHGRSVVSETPRRGQNRSDAVAPSPAGFANEPDTDFVLSHNREWIAKPLAREHDAFDREVPLGIDGEPHFERPVLEGFDPSRPGCVPYRFAVATEPLIERALAVAERAARRCASVPPRERAAWLGAAAQALARRRGELIAAMVLDGGKRIDEADAEVSEAIDFARYYAESFLELCARRELAFTPRGVSLVTPPWNFPLAIPAGGVLGALMAGNAVLLKPALETVLVAARLADTLWEAGVPRDVLQLCTCEDELGSRLIRDPRVAQVVLTGATSTAALFYRLRPELELMAETGGKNALIVSALADRDLAIKDALTSAFRHAGQKCSAASLLICEAELYDDPTFLETLRDAAESLPVGSAWQPENVVTPLIHPPRGPLARALSRLEPGERWLLSPRTLPDNPRCVTPGIKLDVTAGSFTHRTELFGPILGVMRARDLEHALELANGTPYGLTAGLHSLDEREQASFAARMRAGNLYVNRPTTGAIVRRQPFGGTKASSFGPGAKAGGPNYVAQMTRVADGEAPDAAGPPATSAAALLEAVGPHVPESSRRRLGIAASSYAQELREHFGVDHDPSRVLGERNVFRYRPCHPMLLRAAGDADVLDVLLGCAAALTAGVEPMLSVAPNLLQGHDWLRHLPGVHVRAEGVADAAARVAPGRGRVRAIGSVEPELRAASLDAGVHVAADPVLAAGRIELLHYHREQSVSTRFHRYGNLAGERLQPALRGRSSGDRDASG